MSTEQENTFYCCPAVWADGNDSGWVLLQEKVTAISGNSGWTNKKPGEPDVIAYRNTGEHTWFKGPLPNPYGLKLDRTRREEVTKPEAVGLLLMARK